MISHMISREREPLTQTEVQTWQKKVKEEVQYFQEIGAMSAVEEGARILRESGRGDVKVVVERRDPYPDPVDWFPHVRLELQWNCHFNRDVWKLEYEAVILSVAREKGKIQGLNISPWARVFSDPAEIRATVVDAIQHPVRGSKEAPTLVRLGALLGI